MPMHMNEWRRSLTQITGKTEKEILKVFYQEIHKWICDGMPENKSFSEKSGLCANLTCFLQDYGLMGLARRQVEQIMWNQFVDADLDDAYPFNIGTVTAYKKEQSECRLYQNPLRLKWIKDHAA
ncbi:hypothetical protein [Rhizobium phage RHEph16]|uniref:Uncharacterized protein n=1 Tax=Rhizobium phage RHEph16 TaxID=2836132 RepID=A0AAE8AVC9_9CAUD|nr:hypothetical protein PP750_gp21 [Rhizobium phage RHEph16]QXV74330.1 hypothetical protein [Rhizobium phage RHEph16]